MKFSKRNSTYRTQFIALLKAIQTTSMTKSLTPTRIFYILLLFYLIGSFGMNQQKNQSLKNIEYHIYGIIFDYLIDPLPFSFITRQNYAYLPIKLTQLNDRILLELDNAEFYHKTDFDSHECTITSVKMLLDNVERMFSSHKKMAKHYPKTNVVYDFDFHNESELVTQGNLQFETVVTFFNRWMPVIDKLLAFPIITSHRWRLFSFPFFDVKDIILLPDDHASIVHRYKLNQFDSINEILYFENDIDGRQSIRMKLPLYFMLTFPGPYPTYLYLTAISAHITANPAFVTFRFSGIAGKSRLRIETRPIDIHYNILTGIFFVDVRHQPVILQTFFDLKQKIPPQALMAQIAKVLITLCADNLFLGHFLFFSCKY